MAHTMQDLIDRYTYAPLTGQFRKKSDPGSVRIGAEVGGWHCLRISKPVGAYVHATDAAWFMLYGEWLPGEIRTVNHSNNDTRAANLVRGPLADVNELRRRIMSLDAYNSAEPPPAELLRGLDLYRYPGDYLA